MKFVLASHNAHKLAEMQQILPAQGIEVVLQSELGMNIDVEESGETFLENARLKAVAVMQASGLPAIADDSGLCVDCLNGAPGVYSARYGGEGLSDKERYELLLGLTAGQLQRSARFVSAIVCALPNGDLVEAEGSCEGTLAYAPRGEGGFGYDPVFFVPELKKTFAQLTAEEKNEVSHRANALRKFQQAWQDYQAKH